jgi:riboflavin kinase/FMN adenylyltransferase
MNDTLHAFAGLDAVRLPARSCQLAIGMFDGMHRGHQSVVEGAVLAAQRRNGLAGVLTFWPHPSRLFRPDDPTRMIFDAAARRELIARLNVDFIIEQPFTRDFASIEAEAFVPRLQQALPDLETIFVGENWRFGHGRRGDVPLLIRLARACGVNVVSTDRVSYNGEPVSSTRIRELLERGEIAAAGDLLGFPYFCRGEVVPGRRLGRTLGFPTLNLDWQPDRQPARGVYVVRARALDGGPDHPGVANYGVRPTIAGDPQPVFEVHLLGECPFVPGDRLRVEWLARLRAEEKFASLDALRAQIARDRDAAREYFSLR